MTERDLTVTYPDVHVKLTGYDGNGAFIIGCVAKALRRAGHREAADEFVSAAMDSESYEDMLRLAMRTVAVS